jgi:hypothetical protein
MKVYVAFVALLLADYDGDGWDGYGISNSDRSHKLIFKISVF